MINPKIIGDLLRWVQARKEGERGLVAKFIISSNPQPFAV